jgi:hypothetical protein
MADGHSTPLLLACSRCKQTKPVDEFRRRPNRPASGKRMGRWSQCIACEGEAAKTPRRRALANQRTAEFRQRLKTRDYAEYRRRERQGNLRRLYGLSIEQYDALLASQGGGCAICGERGDGGRWRRRLHVDHDHRTGKVRGLLCHGCNVGVGHFDDSPELMQRAAAYLGKT